MNVRIGQKRGGEIERNVCGIKFGSIKVDDIFIGTCNSSFFVLSVAHRISENYK